MPHPMKPRIVRLEDYLSKFRSVSKAVMSLNRQGVPLSWILVHRWTTGKVSPSAVWIELLRREGVDVSYLIKPAPED